MDVPTSARNGESLVLVDSAELLGNKLSIKDWIPYDVTRHAKHIFDAPTGHLLSDTGIHSVDEISGEDTFDKCRMLK